MPRLNMLEFGSKQKTLFSISLLYSENFRKSRSETKSGRRLYNKELARARKKIRQYKIKLTKPLPTRMKV